MKATLLLVLLLLGALLTGCQKTEPEAPQTPKMENPNAVPNPEAGKAAPANLSTAEKDRIEGKG